MKPSYLLTLLFFIGLAFNLSAQTFVLKGSIQNDGNEVVPFATLVVYQSADSAIAKTGVADGNGNFRMVGLKAGNYFLKVSSIGLAEYSSDKFEIKGNKTLPLIRMKVQSQELNEVTVEGQRSMVEIQADRTVFNVDKAVSTIGSTGFEALRKAPGIIIDNNNNVMLDGKSGVQLYVDGKPMQLSGADLTNYLEGLSASEIEAIELITQPSAKFDAAGSAGIINIRLKKDLRYGLKGTLETGFTQGVYPKFNNRIALSQRNRKVNFYSSYNNQLYRRWNFINLRREQLGNVFDKQTETTSEGTAQQMRAGLDYFISPKSTLGVVVNSSYRDNETRTGTVNDIFLGSDTLSQVLISGSNNDDQQLNVFGNINYRFKDTVGREFSVDLDYGYYENEGKAFQPNLYLDPTRTQVLLERNFRMLMPLDITILSAKADYEFPLKKFKIATGAKVNQVISENEFGFYEVTNEGDVFSTDRSNNFRYEELVNAGYVQISRGGKKFSYQAGLRAEQTISEGLLTSFNNQGDSLVKRDYLNWFPSGGISYNHSRAHRFGMRYSRRITRPTYQSLNPFEQVLDELSFMKGNPFLQPQYTHDLKLTHTFMYTLNTSITYSYVEDYFAQITDTADGNRAFLTSRNVADQQVLSANISSPFEVKKWWNVFVSVTAFQTNFTANTEEFKPISQRSLNAYGQNTFSLPKEWKLELSGWYNSPTIWGGTYKTGHQGSIDLAIQKQLFDKKLSFRMAVTDIFFTAPWEGDMEFGALKINGNGGWESRTFRVNLRYNFGNSAMKNVRLRDTGAKEAKDRIQ